MRYMKHVKTGEIRQVSHDDDTTFNELQAERLDDSTPAWAQTGAHDPAVATVVGKADPGPTSDPETPTKPEGARAS